MSWNARSKLMKFAKRGTSRHPFSTRALPTTMAAISIWRLSFAKTGRSIQDWSFDLSRHELISETLHKTRNRLARAAQCRAGIVDGDHCEDRFGIGRIRPDQRALGLEQGLAAWRHRFADRIFPFTEAAALAYGDIMSAALRQGRPMTAPDGMIAAIVRLNGGRLATRNLPDFETTGLELISPWDF